MCGVRAVVRSCAGGLVRERLARLPGRGWRAALSGARGWLAPGEVLLSVRELLPGEAPPPLGEWPEGRAPGPP